MREWAVDALTHRPLFATSTTGRISAMLVAAIALAPIAALATPVSVAQAKTCQAPAGRYDVTPPPRAPSDGADPAAVAAANCTLGFREEQAYPLSVIALALLATAGTLMLVRRRTPDDLIGSQT